MAKGLTRSTHGPDTGWWCHRNRPEPSLQRYTLTDPPPAAPWALLTARKCDTAPTRSVTAANATDDAAAAAAATYVAHFESAPAATAPGLSPAAALLLRPGDVGGDIVTGFAPALDVPMAGRTFRVSVRARAGSLPRDVLLYGGRRGPPGRPPPPPTHTLGSSLRARAGAGPPGQEPGRHARGLQPERLAAGRLGCCIRVRAALLRMRAAPAARSPPCSESEGSVPVFFEIFY